MRKLVVAVPGVILLAGSFLFLAGLGVYLPFDLLFNLAAGWLFYLQRVLPQVRVNWMGLATAIVCLIALAVGLQWFLRWFAQQMTKKHHRRGIERSFLAGPTNRRSSQLDRVDVRRGHCRRRHRPSNGLAANLSRAGPYERKRAYGPLPIAQQSQANDPRHVQLPGHGNGALLAARRARGPARETTVELARADLALFGAAESV